MQSNIRIHSLDFLKAIAAFLVCYQHACGNGFASSCILALSKVAVPVFIMITGYMYKDTANKNHRLSQIKRYVLIALEMALLRFLFDAGVALLKHNLRDYLYQFTKSESIVRFLLFNDPIIADHAWYLWALIYVLILVLLIPQLQKDTLLNNLIIVVCLLLCTILGRYSFLFGKPYTYYYIRNFFCIGLPYLLIGMRLRKLDEAGKLPSQKIIAWCFISFVALQLAEYTLLSKVDPYTEGGIYFITPFLSVSLFCFFLKLKKTIKENHPASIIGRKYSLFIYAFHPLLVRIEKSLINMNSLWAYLGVIAVFMASLALAVLYSQTLKKLRWFRNVF